VGHTFGRVAGSADVAEHLPALNVIALLEPVSVAPEMGVVIHVPGCGIKLVNRGAACLALKQPCDAAVLDRQNGCVPWPMMSIASWLCVRRRVS
jgi:hypothetical protein